MRGQIRPLVVHGGLRKATMHRLLCDAAHRCVCHSVQCISALLHVAAYLQVPSRRQRQLRVVITNGDCLRLGPGAWCVRCRRSYFHHCRAARQLVRPIRKPPSGGAIPLVVPCTMPRVENDT